jgi:hypothetical protein
MIHNNSTFVCEIYDELLKHCAPPRPLAEPWQCMADGPDVIGPVRNRFAAVAALGRFPVSALVAAGVIVRNRNLTLELSRRISEPSFVGLALRDAAGRPTAILTEAGMLAPNSALPLRAVQIDAWSAERIRKLGRLMVAADMDGLRRFRAAGVPATLAVGLDRVTAWPDAGEFAPEAPGQSSIDELLASALAAEQAAAAKRRGGDEADDEATNEGTAEAPAGSTRSSTAEPTDAADQSQSAEPEELPGDARPKGRAAPLSAPLIVLAGGSLCELSGAIPPAIAGAAKFLVQLRDLGGRDLDRVRARSPPPELWPRLRFALANGMADRVRELLAESIAVTGPVDELVESPPPAAADYFALRAELVAALNDRSPPTAHGDRRAKASHEFDDYIDRTCIRPLLDDAHRQTSPVRRAAGVTLADANRDLLRLGPLVEAALSDGDANGGADLERALRLHGKYRALYGTVAREIAKYHRMTMKLW